MNHLRITVLACLSVSIATGQTAQQGPVTERNVSLPIALDAAQAAVDRYRADGFRVTVVVLDRGGNIKVVLRDDTTSPHTVDTARKKAFTSLAFRIPSSDFIQRSEAPSGDADAACAQAGIDKVADRL